VQSAGYNESRLAGAIDQLHDYLAIVGLIALLLGGIGVASGVHAFVMRKIDPVAILRCVGATSWQVLAIYTTQAAVMGLVGAAAGVVLGLGIQFAMPYVLHDFLPVDVDLHLAPRPILLGWRSASGWHCSSRCVRWSRCAACRRYRRCGASPTPMRVAPRAGIRCASRCLAIAAACWRSGSVEPTHRGAASDSPGHRGRIGILCSARPGCRGRRGD
jgi:hypothetical protein